MNTQTSSKELVNTLLHSFGVSFYDFQEVQGATVTLYKLRPSIGTRVSKIRGLKDELAAALGVPSVRIIAPMDDGSVGIEIPNKERETVTIGSLINSWNYQNTAMALPCVLGRTVNNEIFMADLADMPHLLVAGATGQGKSIGLNVIIMSLLQKKSPDELKFILIDPKQVEFNVYAPLEGSYLATPVITEAGEAIRTLQSVCNIMDERYELLSSVGVRNIKEYNAISIVERLPYLVIVIDEFADIMLTSRTNKALLEEYICRLAQKARAVGIHVIVSTQRPSTEFVTGCVKANFPARIAFRTTTGIDSRVILGQSGAEKLTGNGDMLFFSGSETTRVQCAYASIEEVRSLCDELSERYADYSNASPINHNEEGCSIELNDVEYLVSQISPDDGFLITKVMLILLVREDEISFNTLGRKVNDILWKVHKIRRDWFYLRKIYYYLDGIGCLEREPYNERKPKRGWLGRGKEHIDLDEVMHKVRIRTCNKELLKLGLK